MPSILAVELGGRAVDELWWVGIIEAALALFFGISAIFWPGLTLLTLVYLFSAFIIGLGLIEVISALASMRQRGTWWITLLIGTVGVGAGIYLVRHPDLSFVAFIVIISLVLIARGILDIVRAFIDDTNGRVKTLMTIIGAAAIVTGILILRQPVAGGVAFVWILGLYALMLGTLGMAIGFELRLLSLIPDKKKGGTQGRTG